MPTSRAMRDTIANALDYLAQAELALFTTAVAMKPSRVTWQPVSEAPFLIDDHITTVERYLDWVGSGHYSAALYDGSLIQLTYDFEGNAVVGHRLAYVPCPVEVDEHLLLEAPIADCVEVHLELEPPKRITLQSPLRFDFASADAAPGHPAAHLTINRASCRVACIAPLHPYRFLDFVFRHFYPGLWQAHAPWFSAGEQQHLGERVMVDTDTATPHVAWDLHASVRHE
jgi:hypothetical protein